MTRQKAGDTGSNATERRLSMDDKSHKTVKRAAAGAASATTSTMTRASARNFFMLFISFLLDKDW